MPIDLDSPIYLTPCKVAADDTLDDMSRIILCDDKLRAKVNVCSTLTCPWVGQRFTGERHVSCGGTDDQNNLEFSVPAFAGPIRPRYCYLWLVASLGPAFRFISEGVDIGEVVPYTPNQDCVNRPYWVYARLDYTNTQLRSSAIRFLDRQDRHYGREFDVSVATCTWHEQAESNVEALIGREWSIRPVYGCGTAPYGGYGDTSSLVWPDGRGFNDRFPLLYLPNNAASQLRLSGTFDYAWDPPSLSSWHRIYLAVYDGQTLATRYFAYFEIPSQGMADPCQQQLHTPWELSVQLPATGNDAYVELLLSRSVAYRVPALVVRVDEAELII